MTQELIAAVFKDVINSVPLLLTEAGQKYKTEGKTLTAFDFSLELIEALSRAYQNVLSSTAPVANPPVEEVIEPEDLITEEEIENIANRE